MSSAIIRPKKAIFSTLIVIVLSAFGTFFGINYGFESIVGIMNTLLLIVLLQWVFHFLRRKNYITICLVVGFLLFGIGKLLEVYSNYFITNLF